MTDSILLDVTRDWLVRYGRWVRAGGVLPRYERVDSPLDEYDGSEMLTDDQALIVDKALALLSRVQPFEGKAVKWAYIDRREIRVIARDLGRSYGAARELLRMGECIMSGLLQPYLSSDLLVKLG
ncbi:antiterminator Q family protein [Hahella sp. HN01]|uniref:antiterminator Q family protein n=1 Tax=Hahella sp. HN01 TaxID=2847262 RepID=UPI001C1F0B62|nr:antiterminator Q family protein [Hahella sp. HN01]MBU6954552.1 hypothetical protein [Hahella sp. HN01]